jgi:FdhD protein
MESDIEKIQVWRLTEEGESKVEDIVARESPLTIILNNRELVTLLCSPNDLKYLAIGFLFSEGFLEDKDEIKKILVDDRIGVVRVETKEDKALAGEASKRFITSGCGRGASFYSAADISGRGKIESHLEISTHDILSLVSDFQHRSEVYRDTGGVHSAALCDAKSIIVFHEDLGRHNAIDKIFGECLLENIPTGDRIVIMSGRITSEIVLKVARRNIPVIVSKSAPSDLGVKLANDLGVTLLGFARGKRMNAYTNEWRIGHKSISITAG